MTATPHVSNKMFQRKNELENSSCKQNDNTIDYKQKTLLQGTITYGPDYFGRCITQS